MRVICTTSIRGTVGGYDHGHIYDIDWDSGRIMRKLEVPPPKGERLLLALNPRGGARGGRGVRVVGDEVYVANDNLILKYDLDWNERGLISHQLLTRIHEIDVVHDGIWVASTGNDLAVKLDFSGRVLRVWSPRTDEQFKHAVGLARKYQRRWPVWTGSGYRQPWWLLRGVLKRLAGLQTLPKGTPRHILGEAPATVEEKLLWFSFRILPGLSPDDFHLNCVNAWGNEICVNLMFSPWPARACIVRIEPSFRIELSDDSLNGPHNGQLLDDKTVVVNDTKSGVLKVFDRRSGVLMKSISCEQMGLEGHPWLRGLKRLSSTRVLVGAGATSLFVEAASIPVQVLELDLESEKVLRRVVLCEDGRTSIHGLDASES